MARITVERPSHEDTSLIFVHARNGGGGLGRSTYVLTPSEALALSDALRDAVNTRSHDACPRRVEGEYVHYTCGVTVKIGDYEGGVYAEHVRRLLSPVLPRSEDPS